MAGIINCCGAAIADAGLEMFGLVVAAGDKNTFAAVMPELNQVTGLLADTEGVTSKQLDILIFYFRFPRHIGRGKVNLSSDS